MPGYGHHRPDAPPPVETQVVSIVPPGHPWFFLFFPFFFVFPFPFFCRSSFPSSFSFCLFVLSFFVCFSYRLLRFFFRFSALLSGEFCYFVSALHPPCAACEPANLRIPLVRCILSFLALLVFIYFIFFSSFPIFRFRFGCCLFHPALFLWVLFMMSPRFWFMLCVLHIKPAFLPVDIQHTQCPAHPVSVPILPPREIQTSSVVTKPRHRDTTL